MEDTGSEGRKATVPPRCPCGFWGSRKTMNLCSKCFADIQKKQSAVSSSTRPSSMSGCSQSSVFSSEASSSGSTSQALSGLPSCPEQPPTKTDLTSALSNTGSLCTDAACVTIRKPAKRQRDSDEEQVKKRARINDRPSLEESAVVPKQKNRSRCHRCHSKLKLVQQELGSCRCGYIFCMLHRLPEQHECEFDHLSHGQQEARLKMVKLDRKLGRSCHRIE